MAALRRSSRDIVDAERASCRAISRTPALRARSRAICSRSANDPAAHAKSIELEGHLPSETLLVRGDPTRLEQVFWNIVQNAVKFTPPGGSVRATMRPSDAWIEAAIRDTGRGISPEFLPHLFERFRQEDAAPHRTEGGGLGLGMAITRTLVELHRGSIFGDQRGAGAGEHLHRAAPRGTAPRGGSRSVVTRFAIRNGAAKGRCSTRHTSSMLSGRLLRLACFHIRRALQLRASEVLGSGAVDRRRITGHDHAVTRACMPDSHLLLAHVVQHG